MFSTPAYHLAAQIRKSTKTRRAHCQKQNLIGEGRRKAKERGYLARHNSRVPAEKTRPTIWPVLGTIASYYADNKRQWGHAKVTLPARLAPLLPAQRGLTAGCTMHDRGKSERDGGGVASLAGVFPHTPAEDTRMYARRACTQRPGTQTVTNACSPCTWWGRVQASFGPENLPTFLVARANSVRVCAEEFRWPRTYTHSAGLDEDGGSCEPRARFEQHGLGWERDRAIHQPFSRRGWRRGRR